MVRALLICLLWLAAGIARAEAPLRCVVCQSLINGQFVWWQGPTSPVKQPVCLACSKIDTTCAICKIPIKNQGHTLADGRLLCDPDFRAGIFVLADALRIYEEAWRDLQGILGGTGILPRQNITVELVDEVELKKLNASLPAEDEERSLVGLTRTRIFGNHDFQHRIYLVNGLGPARLAAVCAHEYTHTWLHENVPASRGLDRDTVEGFCELVAYKLMTQRQEEGERRLILANAYTRGQVKAFVQAEAEHHFHRVLNWVKTGVDDVLSVTNSERVLAVHEEDPTVLRWPPPAPTPTPVPDTLLLRGISTSRTRRFALINDCTLTLNEEGRVRVGNSNLLLRCIAIRDHSAIVRVEGSSVATELFLGSSR